MRWWAIQNCPMTRKLIRKLRTLGQSAQTCRASPPPASGSSTSAAIGSTSRVITMANTASLKNTRRSRPIERASAATVGSSIATQA